MALLVFQLGNSYMKNSKFDLSVLSVKSEVDDYSSIFFTKPMNFTFEPGDCFDLRFSYPDFQEGRIFSFSSSPTEKHLRITYRKGLSSYKKKLEKVTAGSSMHINYYGNQYVFHHKKPLILIAGGIGITVFRSFIKKMIDLNLHPAITLIYINRTEKFPFENELNEWKELLPLTIHFWETQSKGRLDQEKFSKLLPDINQIKYEHYIVGPPPMVDAAVEILQKFGIENERIHTDSFDGYYEESR